MQRKVLLLGFCAFAAASPVRAQWSLEVVDPHRYAGLRNDLKLDSAGRPHLSYYTIIGTTDYLRYARHDGSGWDLQTIESIGTSGGHGIALALDSQDRANIAYNHSDGFKHAVRNSGGWWVTTIDAGSGGNVGRDPALDLDSQDRCRAIYYDNDAWYNKYAVQDAAGWQVESPLGSGMAYPWVSLAIDAADNTHIAGVVSDRLAYAVRTGTVWETQTGIAHGGVNSSLALDSQGYPHIVHGQQHPADLLRYTHWDGSQWHTELVASNVHVSGGVALALDSKERPRISFIARDPFGTGRGVVMHARRVGTLWYVDSVLDEATAAGCGTSLVIDEHDLSLISYHSSEDDRGLMLARGIPEPATLMLLGLGGLALLRRRRRK